MPRRRALTWNDALDRYETHLRARRKAALTVSNYLRALHHLQERVAPLRPDQVRLTDLREFQAALLAGGASRSGRSLSPSAVCRQSCAWRSFFAFLVDEELLAENPAARLDPPKVARRAPGAILTVKEVERLLEATAAEGPTGLRDRAVVETLYATGLRRGELCALDLTDVEHDEREVRVRAGKGGEGRVVPITRSAYVRLREYLDLARPRLASSHRDSGAALFLTRFGSRLDAKSVERLLNRARQRAGLKKCVQPHLLRRTFASHLLRGGADLRTIQHLLGHGSLAVTAVYLRLDAAEVRREVLLKHPRERFA